MLKVEKVHIQTHCKAVNKLEHKGDTVRFGSFRLVPFSLPLISVSSCRSPSTQGRTSVPLPPPLEDSWAEEDSDLRCVLKIKAMMTHRMATNTGVRVEMRAMALRTGHRTEHRTQDTEPRLEGSWGKTEACWAVRGEDTWAEPVNVSTTLSHSFYPFLSLNSFPLSGRKKKKIQTSIWATHDILITYNNLLCPGIARELLKQPQ